MVGWSLALPVLKRMLPAGRLAAVLWTPSRTLRSESREQAVVAASARLTRLRPGLHANCLERSLLAYRFLARAGADPQLVLGVETLDGAVVGHAWVTLDGNPIHESTEAVSGFTPLVEFGEAGRPSHVGNDAGDFDLPRVWR